MDTKVENLIDFDSQEQVYQKNLSENADSTNQSLEDLDLDDLQAGKKLQFINEGIQNWPQWSIKEASQQQKLNNPIPLAKDNHQFMFNRGLDFPILNKVVETPKVFKPSNVKSLIDYDPQEEVNEKNLSQNGDLETNQSFEDLENNNAVKEINKQQQQTIKIQKIPVVNNIDFQLQKQFVFNRGMSLPIFTKSIKAPIVKKQDKIDKVFNKIKKVPEIMKNWFK